MRLISYDQTWFKYLQLQLMVEVVQHRGLHEMGRMK